MGNFTKNEIQYAQEVQKQYGVPVSVTLAQYALESGYGKSTVGKNNFFNIKGNGTGGYRDYSSKEESFLDFGKLLSSSRYTSKTANATTVQEYVQGVKDGGYAEDPNYVSKVLKIIEDNDLTKYDSNSYEWGKKSYIGGTGNSIGLTWWGDIVKVVLVILAIGGGVLLLSLAVTD